MEQNKNTQHPVKDENYDSAKQPKDTLDELGHWQKSKVVTAKTNENYIIKLQKTIDAIDTARVHLLDILNAEIKLEDISDEKWKGIVDGKTKASESAIAMLKQIKELEAELQAIKNPDAVVEKKKEKKKGGMLGANLES